MGTSSSVLQWNCPTCRQINPVDRETCMKCCTRRQSSNKQTGTTDTEQFKGNPQESPQDGRKPLTASTKNSPSTLQAVTSGSSEEDWMCQLCTFQNSALLVQCEMCTSDKTSAASAATPSESQSRNACGLLDDNGEGQVPRDLVTVPTHSNHTFNTTNIENAARCESPQDDHSHQWQCLGCKLMNPVPLNKCIACDEPFTDFQRKNTVQAPSKVETCDAVEPVSINNHSKLFEPASCVEEPISSREVICYRAKTDNNTTGTSEPQTQEASSICSDLVPGNLNLDTESKQVILTVTSLPAFPNSLPNTKPCAVIKPQCLTTDDEQEPNCKPSKPETEPGKVGKVETRPVEGIAHAAKLTKSEIECIPPKSDQVYTGPKHNIFRCGKCKRQTKNSQACIFCSSSEIGPSSNAAASNVDTPIDCVIPSLSMEEFHRNIRLPPQFKIEVSKPQSSIAERVDAAIDKPRVIILKDNEEKPLINPGPDSGSSDTKDLRDTWSCTVCTLSNQISLDSCKICGTSRVSNIPVVDTIQPPRQQTNPQKTWVCTRCTFENTVDVNVCTVCEGKQEATLTRKNSVCFDNRSEINPNKKPDGASISRTAATQWTCKRCTFLNGQMDLSCTMCDYSPEKIPDHSKQAKKKKVPTATLR